MVVFMHHRVNDCGDVLDTEVFCGSIAGWLLDLRVGWDSVCFAFSMRKGGNVLYTHSCGNLKLRKVLRLRKGKNMR